MKHNTISNTLSLQSLSMSALRRSLLVSLALVTSATLLQESVSHAASNGPVQVAALSLSTGAQLRRDIVLEDGSSVRVTVTPPEGQRVDARVLQEMQIRRATSAGDAHAIAMPEFLDEKSEGAGGPLLNLSGYQVDVQNLTATSCQAGLIIAWSSSTTLNAAAAMNVTFSSTPEEVIATAYPVGGDVNIAVYDGSTLISSSKQGTAKLDMVGVYNSACANSSSLYKVVISNPSSTASARWVGVITAFFVNQ